MAEIQTHQSYEVLAEEGRRTLREVDGYQWKLGDLAVEVEHLPSHERPRDPETGGFLADDKKALHRFADDIDIPFRTIQTYRWVAEAYPHDQRVRDVGYKAHEALVAQDDRFELIHEGMTVREALRLVTKRNAASYHPPGWMETIGEAGDALKKAQKQLDKLDAAIGRQPNQKFRDKAARYAEWADDVAARLRRFADWTED